MNLFKSLLAYTVINSFWYNFISTDSAFLSVFFPILSLYIVLFDFMFAFTRESADSDFRSINNYHMEDILFYSTLAALSPLTILIVFLPKCSKNLLILTYRRMMYVPWKVNQNTHVSPFNNGKWYSIKDLDRNFHEFFENSPQISSNQLIIENMFQIRAQLYGMISKS